jgi:hypothetical protein
MPAESKPGGEVILYQTEDSQTRVQVRLDGKTAWLTQAQMAELFQTTQQNVSLHIQNIYKGATKRYNVAGRQVVSRWYSMSVAA